MDYVKLGEESVYLLAFAGGIVALVIYLRKDAKKNRKNKLLIKLNNATFTNEDDLSWFIAHDVMGKAGYPDCVVYKVDQQDQVCRQIAAFGPKNPDKMSILNPINIPFGRGIVGHVAMTGKGERIDDTTKDPRYVPDDDVRYSELSMPVFLDGKCVMVIDSEHKTPSWFKDADVNFVLQVTQIASMQLQRMRK